MLALALAVLLSAADAAPAPPRAWMTHQIERGETLAAVAARWGVSEDELLDWNPWVRAAGGRLAAKKILQIRASARPPLRMRAVYVVADGETWESVAERVGTTAAILRADNRAHADGPLPVQARIVVVRDATRDGWDPYAGPPGPPAPAIEIPYGGLSFGRPNAGSLVNGVRLPDTDLYELPAPDSSYGSTHAVQVVVAALAAFRQRTAYPGKVVIGAMSRREGGRFAPHKSHRSGRDVDIRLPRLDGSGAHARHDEVDWHATWALVRAFVATGQTEAIFLSQRLHPLLRRAAIDMGATADELASIGSIVVHAKGHHSHIHVRIGCGIDETDCLDVAVVRAGGRGATRGGRTRARAVSIGPAPTVR